MHSEALEHHFGQIAPLYNELRLPDEVVTPLLTALVAAGDLRGKRVLDIGCGTGRLLCVLAQQYQVQGWGIDASLQMLEVAQAQAPSSVHLQQATAEALPFADDFFERVYMTVVVHLLNRPVVLPEIWRVLQPGGRVTIMTPDPAFFARSWLSPFFPSYTSIEQGRFPDQQTLEEEMSQAGLLFLSCNPLKTSRTLSKEVAMRRIRERHISTFALINDDEYQEGVARAEQELPEWVTSTQESFLISAEKRMC